MTYTPGFYKVRLPRDDRFGRGLAIARKIGDYDRDEGTWYVGVSVPGAASAYMLAELAELGAVITKKDREEPS